MSEFSLNYQGNLVKIFLCRDGDWRHDSVFIYNTDKKSIKDAKIRAIMQYLYDEAYIKDRRTKYEIFDGAKEK